MCKLQLLMVLCGACDQRSVNGWKLALEFYNSEFIVRITISVSINNCHSWNLILLTDVTSCTEHINVIFLFSGFRRVIFTNTFWNRHNLLIPVNYLSLDDEKTENHTI